MASLLKTIRLGV